MRRAEALAVSRPRLGKAKRPEANILELAQNPSLGFADTTFETLEMRHGRPQLRGYWLGLTGPMVERSSRTSPPQFPATLADVWSRRYGETQVWFATRGDAA